MRCPYEIVAERLLSKPRVGHILSSEEALAMYRLFSELFEPFSECDHNRIVVDNTNSDKIVETTSYILEEMDLR